MRTQKMLVSVRRQMDLLASNLSPISKIALIGATGYVGAKILDEALRRGHTVTAIVRNIDKLPKNNLIIPVAADVNDSAELRKHFHGLDAVIHAYAPPRDKEVTERVAMQRTATKSIISALKNPDSNASWPLAEQAALKSPPAFATWTFRVSRWSG